MQLSRMIAFAGLWAFCSVSARAQDSRITIDLTKAGPRLSPLQHGIFYEEINHAGDGGLNAELIRNGNFADGLAGWEHWAMVQGELRDRQRSCRCGSARRSSRRRR